MPRMKVTTRWLSFASAEAEDKAKQDMREITELASKIANTIDNGERPHHGLIAKFHSLRTAARIRSIMGVNTADEARVMTVRHVLATPKCQETLRILSNMGPDERVAIVSHFTSVLDAYARVLTSRKISHVEYKGTLSSSVKKTVLNVFLDDSTDVNVLLLSADAAGVGLNLRGEHMIMLDAGFSYLDDEQVFCRFRRLNQGDTTIDVNVLRMNHGIDKYLFKRQRDKLKLAKQFSLDVDPIQKVLEEVFEE